MDRTMNGHQENYLLAKALVETLEAEVVEAEKTLIREHAINHADYGIPTRLWEIEDMETLNALNNEYQAIMEQTGLQEKLNDARALLKKAEDSLITLGLSLAPADAKATIQEAVEINATRRQQLLEMTLSLDVSTLPKEENA